MHDAPLSERELEVARLIAAGYSNKHMASELGISHNTVTRHVANIMRKMEAGSERDTPTVDFVRLVPGVYEAAPGQRRELRGAHQGHLASKILVPDTLGDFRAAFEGGG